MVKSDRIRLSGLAFLLLFPFTVGRTAGCTSPPRETETQIKDLLDRNRRQVQTWNRLTRSRDETSTGGAAPSDDSSGSDHEHTSSAEKTFRLSLEQASRMALGENLAIRQSSIEPMIARANASEELGAFDPTAYARARTEDAQTPTGSTLSGAALLKTEENLGRSGLRGRTTLGTEYDLFFELVRDESNSRFRTLDPQYQSAAGVQITQPLLKGLGPDVQLARYRARLNELSARQQEALSTMNETLLKVHQAYWNLVHAREEREIARNAVDLARETVSVNEARFEADQIPEVDLTQARTHLSEQREQLRIKQSNARDAADQLLRLVSPPGTSVEDWRVTVIPTSGPDLQNLRLDRESRLIDLALEVRPDLRALQEQVEAREEMITSAKDRSLPSLDLEVGYRRNALAGDDSEAFDQLDRNDRRTWNVGLVFQYPLGNRDASGNLREQKLKRRASMLQIRQLKNTISRQVRQAVRSVRTARSRVRIARQSRDLAEKQLKAARVRRDAGLTTTFQVLRFQEDVRRTRSRLLQARVDYAGAVSRLRNASGMLVSKYLK